MALNFCNNNSLSAITTIPSGISGGGLNLISTQTASSSSSLSFTSGINSTYKEYIFKFYNIHPQSDNQELFFNFSTDGGSNYNVTKTTTTFQAYHNEAGSDSSLSYHTAGDLAQSTNYQRLGFSSDNADDASLSGYLHLFEPSSDTFVKHFTATTNMCHADTYSVNYYLAGYCNTTSAVNAIRFAFGSGNIDSGVIKLYGVS
tara:strand:+ start:142 stop:747 length:606 start_codon:yes stop_codon:yes gene_type:complete